MGNIIKTEFLKLKRYSVIKAGIIMTVLSPLLSLFYSTANGGQTWTFDYFMQQVMISNCTLFFPIIIALIAGYIITREYTDDTMKNISTIPIPYKQLLSGKLLVLLLLTIIFSLIGCVIALVINIIAGFPGAHFGNLFNMFIRVTGANIGIYISVLPIILLFCCSANNFLGGVALAFVYGYFRFRSKAQVLSQIAKSIPLDLEKLPLPQDNNEAALQQMIHELNRMRMEAEEARMTSYREMADYYTMWVHQIKTPIASMRLTLEGSDSPESRKLSAELGRIERYVEMALVYLRLDSESSDYVIREFELDPFIRRSVKKFAGEFISKRLSLELEPSGASVVSDEKWLAFVVEQVLSNSLKYTREGSVRIYLAEPKTLCIRDTGIGIAPEDLPRIFDKGYTGLNGRADLRASGLGLYLCRRVCRKLGHEISAVSAPGKGTEIRIDLSSYDLDPE